MISIVVPCIEFLEQWKDLSEIIDDYFLPKNLNSKLNNCAKSWFFFCNAGSLKKIKACIWSTLLNRNGDQSQSKFDLNHVAVKFYLIILREALLHIEH